MTDLSRTCANMPLYCTYVQLREFIVVTPSKRNQTSNRQVCAERKVEAPPGHTCALQVQPRQVCDVTMHRHIPWILDIAALPQLKQTMKKQQLISINMSDREKRINKDYCR